MLAARAPRRAAQAPRTPRTNSVSVAEGWLRVLTSIAYMAWAEDMTDGTSRTDVLRASPPMFESRLLDALSRVHPLVPIVIFLPAIALLFAWGLSLTSVPLAIG